MSPPKNVRAMKCFTHPWNSASASREWVMAGAITGDEKVRNSAILPTARAKQRPELVWAIYPSVNVARTPTQRGAWHNGV